MFADPDPATETGGDGSKFATNQLGCIRLGVERLVLRQSTGKEEKNHLAFWFDRATNPVVSTGLKCWKVFQTKPQEPYCADLQHRSP